MNNIYEKKVKDIMTPIYDYPVVSSTATIRDTVRVMVGSYKWQENKPRTGRRRVFVVEDNELVGTFGLPELFAAIAPGYLRHSLQGSFKAFAVWSSPVFWEGMFAEACQGVADQQVKKHMIPVEFYVDHNDNILKASHQMTKHKADAVAVKRDGRLVGMVRSADIFQEISRQFAQLAANSGTEWPYSPTATIV